MSKTIRIGTRDSALAMYQARAVQAAIEELGVTTTLHPIKSSGDLDLVTPLYKMGIRGIFTRSLDIALLANRIDIAVHSLKDVPTTNPKGLMHLSVLPRGPVHDVLVCRNASTIPNDMYANGVVGTSSIRRQAQWLRRYPNFKVEVLRGNVQTRLRKLEESIWNGAIFAAAGLQRLGIEPEHAVPLDWMIPAPAQGAIGVVFREDDDIALKLALQLQHKETAICTEQERTFLQVLEGGCTAPIGALAIIRDNTLYFEGQVLSPDGKQDHRVSLAEPLKDKITLGGDAASDVFDDRNARILLKSIRNEEE